MLWHILLALIICVILWKILTQETNNLSRLPGPPKVPFFGSVFAFLGKTQSEMFKIILDLPKQFGNRIVIKALNRYILHVYNVEDIEIVLTHSRNIKKNKPYTFIEPWLGTGLLISTGSKWQKRRKILTPTFHFDILKGFVKVFEEQSKNLTMMLKKRTQESNIIDTMAVISDLTLYIICETAMGIRLNSDKSAAKLKYKNAITDIGRVVIKRLTTFWFHSELIFYNHPIGKLFSKSLNNVHSFADNVIMERKKMNESDGSLNVRGEKRRLALLDLLLDAEKNGEIDLEGIREEVNTFMFEGHDTTATALTFGLMLLADHEEVQERLYEECVSVGPEPTVSQLSEMKYLEAVIKEILRMYPSVPFIGREITEDFMLGIIWHEDRNFNLQPTGYALQTKERCQIYSEFTDDIEIKKGSEVVVHIYAVHRREDLFPEPEVFKPERFLNGDTRHPYAYIPFSAGPRNCIGQRFAKLQLKCVISEIVRNFRLQPMVKGARPDLKFDLVLRPNEPIYVKFLPR